MFYFETLDVKGLRGNCSESYLQVFDQGRAQRAPVKGFKLMALIGERAPDLDNLLISVYLIFCVFPIFGQFFGFYSYSHNI